ncbi:hypothetical protein AB0K60_32920, partial [Thermopolyspora sp. NPDC052614]|uniref:hypothetical protein n=1 Tax=Thermopolyspora sp. NPDC052614 TaxID=3155682 RepID=UPI003438B84A
AQSSTFSTLQDLGGGLTFKVPQGVSFQDPATVRLGQTDPARLLTIVATEHDALPRFSLARLESAASFTHILTSLYRALTAHNRDAHLPALATSLSNHALRLSETGRRTEAVPVSEEALRLYSELAD